MRNIKIKRYFFCLMLISGFCLMNNYTFAKDLSQVALHKGQSVFLSVDHMQNDDVLISEDESVASVTKGIITAKSIGETFCKEVKSGENGIKIEKKYKIKVLPPKDVKYIFAEPNIPRCGETITLSAITDDYVDRVKFLVSTKKNHYEKISKDKISDGQNFIHKASIVLNEVGNFNVKIQVHKGSSWVDTEYKFIGNIFEDSIKKAVERRASGKCVEYIKAKEGFKSMIKPDSFSKNFYDIGHGNVIRSGEPFYNNITRMEAHALLLNKLNNSSFSRLLNNFIIKNDLIFSQNQFDALLSFTYNLGVSWINNSCLRDVILGSKNTKSLTNELYKSSVKSFGTVISDNGLRLRAEPNTGSEILEILRFNEKVELLSENNKGWYKVRTESGHEGFCFADFLSVIEQYTKSNIGIVNSDDGLRLRSEPNLQGKVISVLKFNEQVEVLSKNNNNWYKIRKENGQEGFCFAQFLTVKTFRDKNMSKSDFCDEVLSYHNAGGKLVKGLLYRRIEELQMFFYNDYSVDGNKNKYNFSLPDCV